MRIPSVTEQDLIAFHHTHFPSASLPSNFLRHAQGDDAADDGPYGLGYYDDGVPRTLTDNEIAFLREREIQLLLKKRRLKRERNERKEARRLNDASQSEPQTMQDINQTSPRNLKEDGTSIQTHEIMANDGRGASSSASQPHPVAQAFGLNDNVLNARSHKALKRKHKRDTEELRKKSKLQSPMTHSEEFTPRRMARELDESAEAPIQLDY